MAMARNYLLILVAISASINTLSAQSNLKGVIKDTFNNEPIAMVSIKFLEQSKTVYTDFDGNFIAKDIVFPAKIKVSYFGYIDKEIVVDSAISNLEIFISPAAKLLQAVIIKGDKISEKLREQPLTIESMGINAIKATPAANFYEGLGHLKGVDVTTASLGFRVINTRGFNSTSPVRSLQLIDGVDNQSPGLNFSLGNFLGASEIDIFNTDIFAGASTAFFGPNAFNGVINMTTKDPWRFPGLTVSVKVGERNLYEFAVRYAQVFKNKKGEDKFAYKINLFTMRALDWAADNRSATAQSASSANNNGGYDAVNRYGDEQPKSDNNFTGLNAIAQYPGLGRFNRTGYWEKDLVDYNTRNVKYNTLLAYKIDKKNELNYQFNFGEGSTVYQGENRFSLKDIRFFQNRLELKSSKGFIRVYATNEDAGNTYDAVLTALVMQDAAKNKTNWSQDYSGYWIRNGRPQVRQIPGWPSQFFNNPDAFRIADSLLALYDTMIIRLHNEARKVADGELSANGLPHSTVTSDRFAPGTRAFDSMLNLITSRKSLIEGGSGFYDKSALYHFQAQRKFDYKNYVITAGVSGRYYAPNTRGTIFEDTGNRKITNREVGLYGGADKKFLDDKLKASLNFRLDKNENFNLLFSPAASLVYLRNAKNTYRFSFSSAIRNPTLSDQYLYYNVGRAILLGNINGIKNLVTTESLVEYIDKQDRSLLQYFNLDPIKPEQVRTLEAGYKGVIFKDKLLIDVSYYTSFYTNFIGYKLGVDITIDTTLNRLTTAQAYRVATNSKDLVLTTGAAIGLTYSLSKYLIINGNYSWNEFNRMGSTDPLIPAFNTPRHKFNLGFGGNQLAIHLRKWSIRDLSFNMNFKWIEGFLFEGSPQFTGEIESYYLLDAQISKFYKKHNITIKLGASNLTNNLAYQVYGGPQVGRLAYASLLLDIK